MTRPPTRPFAYVCASLLVLSLAACAPSASAPPADTAAPSPTAEPTEPATPDPTETPTPEPVGPPPIEELALTTEGLGTLVIGGAPPADDEQALIVHDAEFCTDERTGAPFGREPGDEFAGLWLPAESYRTDEGPGFVRAPFGVRVRDDRLQRIEIEDESLTTDAGITLGSTAAEVSDAYGDVEVIPMGLTALHVVEGTAGKLVIEVATEDPDVPGYWEADMLDTVVLLRAIPAAEEPYSTAASGNVVNSCPE